MGSSSAEINDQIAHTREHLDANLDVLEKRAASGARRAGMIGGIGLAAALLAGTVAFVVYRRLHKPSVRDRVQDAIPDAFSDFQKELRKRFGDRPFKVVITSGAEDRGGVWESTVRKVAPGIVTSAASALMAQAMKRRASPEAGQTASE